ncbi:coil containing protein [Vibrio phage LP.2]|nr:coil containing protein [Vibrio phage LP.2]
MSFKETIEKLGIENEEAVNALSELFESQQNEITKIKQVNDNLLSDKVKWKEQNESALSEAERIKNEALKQAGDWETLEANLNATHQSELDKLKEQLAGRDKIILGEKNEAVINDLASLFVSQDVGKMMLKNMVATNYSESGEAVTSLNGLDGQSLTTEAAKFAETLKGIPSMANFLKGVDSSGGGSQGSTGSSAAQSNDKDAAYTQRLKDAGLLS